MNGPNVGKLIAHKVSLDAIPPGGNFTDGLRFLMDRERHKKTFIEATAWVKEAIAVIRTAAEPNPWKASTDEEIAGEILRQIEERRKAKKLPATEPGR